MFVDPLTLIGRTVENLELLSAFLVDENPILRLEKEIVGKRASFINEISYLKIKEKELMIKFLESSPKSTLAYFNGDEINSLRGLKLNFNSSFPDLYKDKIKSFCDLREMLTIIFYWIMM